MARSLTKFLRKNTTMIIILFVAIIVFNQYYSYAAAAPRHIEGFTGGDSDLTLIFFSMNGCGHCKKFKPTWQEFVQQNSSGIRTEIVDSNEPLTKDMDVKGFPTVMLVRGSQKVATFEGDRTVADLNAFCKAHSQ